MDVQANIISFGSGVIVSPDGKILTNFHVVEPYVAAILQDQTAIINVCWNLVADVAPFCSFFASAIDFDIANDLAILQITHVITKDDEIVQLPEFMERTNGSFLFANVINDSVELGSEVEIYGFPGVGGDTVTLTKGNISGFEGIYLKTDATVNFGNSGGPAFQNGALVGIATAVSGGAGNIGWLVNGSTVAAMLEKAGIRYNISTSSGVGIFPDVIQNKEAIEYLKGKGIIDGYPDGTFKPNNTVNRAELLKILIESRDPSFDRQGNDTNCFSDISSGQWFTSYVCYAKEKGWVNGYQDGTFRASQAVSKAEAVKIVLNAYGFSIPEKATQFYFSDVNLGDWFAPFIQIAKEQGLLEDMGTTYSPNSGMSRAGTAEIIYRILN